MQRSEAVEILKEILLECRSFEGKSIKLMPPDADSVLSEGFQIHVQKSGTGLETNCVCQVARKYGLQVQDEKDFFVLYKALL